MCSRELTRVRQVASTSSITVSVDLASKMAYFLVKIVFLGIPSVKCVLNL